MEIDFRVVVVFFVAVLLLGGLALLLRGQMEGEAKVGPAKLKFKTKRRPTPSPGTGTATILGSVAERGDATAIGPGGARIEATRAGGSLLARGDQPDGDDSHPKAL